MTGRPGTFAEWLHARRDEPSAVGDLALDNPRDLARVLLVLAEALERQGAGGALERWHCWGGADRTPGRSVAT